MVRWIHLLRCAELGLSRLFSEREWNEIVETSVHKKVEIENSPEEDKQYL